MSNNWQESDQPLVSVVMPAYKVLYLGDALDSVLQQTYRPLELIICDDSTTPEVEQVVDAFRASADFPIIYSRNEKRLWETRSTAKGVSLASGFYVKFLHDDDMLQPRCLEALVDVMEKNPSASLASSKRRLVDEQGQPLADNFATVFPFAGDSLVDGEDLINFLADHTINFIGEPSAVLCRRDDLLQFTEGLSVLNGVRITWVADLALYVKLLKHGHLAMLAEPLTDFRVSKEQFSQKGRDKPGIGEQGHANFRQAVRDLGWYRSDKPSHQVAVAPITRLSARIFKPLDLLTALNKAAGHVGVSLERWLGVRRPSDIQMRMMRQRLDAFAGGPEFLVLIANVDEDAAAVALTEKSLREVSLYTNVDFLVLNCRHAELVAAVNQAVVASQAAWVLIVDAGAEFTVSGLLMIALELLEAPPLQAVYADELLRDEEGRLGVMLRPDFNLDLLLSCPASMGRHWLFNRQALIDSGGFDPVYADAFELAQLLKIIESHGLAGVGHVSEVLLASSTLTLADIAQERQLIEQHLRNRGYAQASVASSLPGRYQLDYGHAVEPGVSILILLRDNLAQLRRCLETLLENTQYPYYEVLLLDHGSKDTDTCNWLTALEQMKETRIRVMHFAANTPEAVVRNQAAADARGDFLLWLSSSAGVLQPDWLQQLLNHGLRPEVGTVGAKQIGADGRVLGGGILLGVGNSAVKAFSGLAVEDAGYMHRLQVEQNYSALSGDCLLMSKALFAELGGFDDSDALKAWLDVDLCLRAGQAGFLNVWTPRAQLLVDSKADKASDQVADHGLYQRWLPLMARDPAYNPGFSLQAGNEFTLADPYLSWNPLQSWKPVPKVLAHPADMFGCGHYRVMQPFNALQADGAIDGALCYGLLALTDFARYAPDVVVFQRQIGEERLQAMQQIKSFASVFKVYELDDYLPNLPMKSIHRQKMPRDIVKSLRRGVGMVDRFVVATDVLAEAFADFHVDVRVVKNRLDPRWWRGLPVSQRGTSSKPRVGWAGGASHTGDLELIFDVVKDLAGEVEWVFFGMCPDKLRPYVHEFHPGVAIEQYPRKLAELNLDLALAPVEQNLFNECKSNLRLLEYGICGYPVICSDVRCYAGDLPVTRVKNRYRDWMDAIRMHLSDLEASAAQGKALQAAVEQRWMLEGEALSAWQQAWLP